jgi:cell division transport system permease protein
MSERMSDDGMNELSAPPRSVAAPPRFETPIVPRNSISGRALISVVGIMTFLASLTVGAVLLVNHSAENWRSDVTREVTIQVRPTPDRNVDQDVDRAAALAKGIAGIADVRAMSKDESAKLLEPFLGAGLKLDELPVPRMIVVTLGSAPDLDQLRRALAADVPSASLDDHRGWAGRMRAMANSVIAAGFVILALMLVATILSVSFATRGAMATNRPVIEVLHFIGARNGFIAGHFQRHFLVLGLQGGLVGGGAAVLLFLLAELLGRWFGGSAAGEQTSALFGTFSIGPAGYGAVAAVIIVIALVTAFTSRHTVNRTLEAID